MTDNRTNEPTDAQVEAAAKVLLRDYQWQYDGGEVSEFLDVARAALMAAQEAAPRTESDERIQAWERLIQHPVWRRCFEEERPLIDSMMERIDNLAELEMTVNELAPAPASSSGVDEDALAEVMCREMDGETYEGEPCDACLGQARAVVAYFRSET